MADSFYGEIRLFGGAYAPQGWAFCDGQSMPINQNLALFSQLGWAFGPTSKTHFSLPDFRGRAAMGAGDGPGLTSRARGVSGGEEGVLLTSDQMPSHTHAMRATSSKANDGKPDRQSYLASGGEAAYAAPANLVSLTPSTLRVVGGTKTLKTGASHNNMQPYVALSFIISIWGLYPHT